MDAAAVLSFQEALGKSTRILALCGAGLSAASGLPTFRGNGGIWRNHQATALATPGAFAANPGLVWQFYAYRRHMALQASPNPAHVALAELAKKMKETDGFACLTQNVDGLSPRAGHPASQLHLLHGSLLDIKCSNDRCDYVDENNLTDPLCPALEVGSVDPTADDKTGVQATVALFNARNKSSALQVNTIPSSELPHCPKCKRSLLRPGVVWFGEDLPVKTLSTVAEWISNSKKIDLMLVIGTTAEVWPAAGYIEKARRKGARVAVINMDASHLGGAGSLSSDDWMFEGDAGAIIPKLLEKVIGKV